MQDSTFRAPTPGHTPELRPTGVEVRPDSGRVVARLFVPGLEEVGPTGSRAGAVISRVLALDEADVEASLQHVLDRDGPRHRDLMGLFTENADRVVALLDPGVDVSPARYALIGACFTHEYSIEAAAVCNPSIVIRDVDADGTAHFVLSVRGIGEGHRSTIGFRTGTVTSSGEVGVDEPSPFARTVLATPGQHHRSVFHASMDLLGDDFTNISRFLALLPPVFDDATLARALDEVAADVTIHRLDPETLGHVTELSRWSYVASFPDDADVSERVLWPHAPPEAWGMEDARMVRFVEEDGTVVYYATYTAFDGSRTTIQLLSTTDFATFDSSPVVGAGAQGKGLALFPRKVNGRYMALTRADRETNGIATSDDLRHWPNHQLLQLPRESWEVLQLGNCGSPIELEEGWLVLTHGVGPMRTYSMGALLLALDDPTRVLRRARTPILAPTGRMQDGYVPNVVYACGGMVHGDALVVPHGVGDQWISFATVSVSELLAGMTPE